MAVDYTSASRGVMARRQAEAHPETIDSVTTALAERRASKAAPDEQRAEAQTAPTIELIGQWDGERDPPPMAAPECPVPPEPVDEPEDPAFARSAAEEQHAVIFSRTELNPWYDMAEDAARSGPENIQEGDVRGDSDDERELANERRPPAEITEDRARAAVLAVLHLPFGSLPEPPVGATGQVISKRYVSSLPNGDKWHCTLKHDGNYEGVQTWVCRRRLLNPSDCLVRQEISQRGWSRPITYHNKAGEGQHNESGFAHRKRKEAEKKAREEAAKARADAIRPRDRGRVARGRMAPS